MPKVKICGITNDQDALWAVNLGADYMGLNFYAQSPRKVSVKHAKDMLSKLPPFVTTVGVFVDEPFESLQKIVKSTMSTQKTRKPIARRFIHGRLAVSPVPAG